MNEFNTIGIETEPCYTYLKINYPDRKWLLSGEMEKSFISLYEIKNSDVVICSDVIEDIVNPDILVDYLISLKSKFKEYYGVSLYGPPNNKCHVREWTMTEFKEYINKKFNILSSFYGIN